MFHRSLLIMSLHSLLRSLQQGMLTVNVSYSSVNHQPFGCEIRDMLDVKSV